METSEKINCLCGWKGTEDELVIGLYESHSSRMPIASECPSCGMEVE